MNDAYNPATSADGNAAKIWELLRRNPAFREQARELVKRQETSLTIKALAPDFGLIDASNPIAGFVLRWLFKPALVAFNYPRQPIDFNTEWTFRERTESGYPFICLEELEYLLKEEIDGESFPGPLTLSNGPFSFSTPWPNTPALFQFLFKWLWQEFEVGNISYSFDMRFLTNGVVEPFKIDWLAIKDRTARIDFRTEDEFSRLQFLLKHHDIFAVPRTTMPKKQLNLLMKRFKELITEIQDHRKTIINTAKEPFLFGSELEWETFTFCYHKAKYELDSTSRFQRTGIGKAFDDIVTRNNKTGKWSPKSDQSTHVKRNYEKMETLMFAIFPSFDLEGLLVAGTKGKKGSGIKGSEATTRSAEFALMNCKEKLDALHRFPITDAM